MLALILLVVIVLFLLAPATHYGGYYPSGWHGGFGWLPAVLLIVLLVWLITSGGIALR